MIRYNTAMKTLFENNSLANIVIANRFVRSATFEGLADKEGAVTQRLTDYMVDLVHGHVGLIITGHAFVSKDGKASPLQMGIHDDSLTEGLAAMVADVHKAGGRIVAQLAHAGCQANKDCTGTEAIGPSVVHDKDGNPRCRQMSTEDIAQLVEAFAVAAKRAQLAGFDGVQIHSAHGYLLSQFLSPHYNKRQDSYGGSVENRARIHLEIIAAIKAITADQFPVMIKMNSEDFFDDGMTIEEMLETAALLETAGIAAIEISGGTLESPIEVSPVRTAKTRKGKDELYYRNAATRYKEKISVPLILVGGIRTLATAEEVVNTNLADYVALSRPLIRQPHLIKQWKQGNTEKATCISCNLCFKPAMSGEGIYCVVERKQEQKK